MAESRALQRRRVIRRASDLLRLAMAYLLLTNDDSLSPTDAAEAYRNPVVIERCFRSMKSAQLRVEPVFRRIERRIVAHVKLCVLALLLQRIAELRTCRTWMRVRQVLDEVVVSQVSTGVEAFWQVHRLSLQAKEIFRLLHVRPPRQLLAVEKA